MAVKSSLRSLLPHTTRTPTEDPAASWHARRDSNPQPPDPKSAPGLRLVLHAKAKAALHEIMRAETRKAAQPAIARFEADYGAKYPKAVGSLRRDEAELLTFFDFPAEHWLHLRTGNVIESPFATVRLRQRVTKGAGSRQKGPSHGFPAPGDGRAALAENQWCTPHPTCAGWASLQRRRSAGKAKRGLTWSRGRVHIERTVG